MWLLTRWLYIHHALVLQYCSTGTMCEPILPTERRLINQTWENPVQPITRPHLLFPHFPRVTDNPGLYSVELDQPWLISLCSGSSSQRPGPSPRCKILQFPRILRWNIPQSNAAFRTILISSKEDIDPLIQRLSGAQRVTLIDTSHVARTTSNYLEDRMLIRVDSCSFWGYQYDFFFKGE